VPRLTFTQQPKTALRGAGACVIIARRERLRQDGLLADLPEPLPQLARELAATAERNGSGPVAFSLASGEVRRLAVGLLPGPGSRYNAPARPDAVARAVHASGVAKESRSSVVLCLDHDSELEGALTGLARALPTFSRKTTSGEDAPRLSVLVLGPDGRPLRVPPEERLRVGAIRDSAALVDTPPSELHPEAFAAEAKRTLEEIKRVTVKEIVGLALQRQKLGGIFGVGKAAEKAPRLLIATYRPTRPTGPHVALVGKGVTFDTGGLHLKGRGSMEGMKCDMGGAAAVFGAFRVLAAAGAPMQISLLLCLAENAIGPAAYKPDDILTLHSGKTVEINNTDAEGRLLLADGLSYAARSLGAVVLLDAATLTGAQLVATGVQHAAVVSNDADLETILVESGRASGDLVHPLPFAPEFFQQEFKSPLADMRNSVKNRANAQSSCAAQFLYSHIDGTDARWAHVDLAGPAFQGERGTGFGVSLLAHAVRSLA
jgi:probable aminopeptidase NPEPL1